MGDSITEGSINEWKKQPGDYVEGDELVAIIDTDKVSVDINAPESGIVTSHHAKPGDTVLVGAPLYDLAPGPPPAGGNSSKPASPIATPSTPISTTPLPSAPAQPTKPTPTSPVPGKALEAPTAGPSVASLNVSRTETIVPMSRLRKRVAERLKYAQNTAASLTTFNECDMSNLMAMRSELNDVFVKTHGIKFGFVSAFLCASARALKNMPQVNAYIAENGNEIVYKNYVDISVAVATPTGLLVPVLRDCEKKSVVDLERDLVHIAQKARDGKIALEEMAGGTFTISNGGVFGSLFGTPILNPPQSSILGLHSIKERAVVKDGEIVVRPIMYLALTYDHRIVDGREAVLFLNAIKDKIEDPRKLILDL